MNNSPQNLSIIETARYLSDAKRLLAYGGLDGIVQRPLLDESGQPFPHFIVEANGYTVVDSMGRSYVDWQNGWGPVLLGYNHPSIFEAIEKLRIAGPTISLMHPLEVEVAAMLVEMIPSAEMVAFGKNGSDSTTAAVRIARAVTKKNLILQCGFHGFQDWYACLHPEVQGIPNQLRNFVRSFRYNQIEELRELFANHKDQIAAVIMEPVSNQLPESDYLHEVKELVHENNALLIFDEIVTMFRVSNGGAQEAYGVLPDLTCIGKSLGNGMPISAVVGKREYMQYLPACGYGMTFRGETFSLAAAKATLQILRNEPVVEKVAEVGKKIRTGFDELAKRLKIRVKLTGPDSRSTIGFRGPDADRRNSARSLFVRECLSNGVITGGTLFPSYAHDEAAIDKTIGSFEQTLLTVKSRLEQHSFHNRRPDAGFLFGPKELTAHGFLDHVEFGEQVTTIFGWLIHQDIVPDKFQIQIPNVKERIDCNPVHRDEIEKAFPQIEGAANCGFKGEIPNELISSGLEFELLAISNEKIVFRCLVLSQSEDHKMNGPFKMGDGVIYI